MGYTVFVSHSEKDLDLVRSIQEAATPLGVTVYAFEQDLQPGCDLSQKLRDRITQSNAMIVLLTKDGSASPAVNQEIGVARQANKLILPILDNGVDPKSFPMIQGLECLPLNRENPAETMQKLTGRLAKLKIDSVWSIVVLLLLGALVFFASRSK